MNEPTKKDGIWIKTNHTYQNVMINQQYANYQDGVWSDVGELPYKCYGLGAIWYNNELHIMGGSDPSLDDDAHVYYHYKFNGSAWIRMNSLPRAAWYVEALLYNNEIYACFTIGRYSSSEQQIYKFNGSTWTFVGKFPYTWSDIFIVYNNSLLCSNPNDLYLYKLNNNTWEKAYLYSSYILDCAVAYNGYIYTFSGASKKYYTFNGSLWQNDAFPWPYNHMVARSIVYNNEIHLLGGDFSNGGEKSCHYRFNGSTFTQISNSLPYLSFYGGALAVHNYELHMLSGHRNSQTKHYKFQLPEKVYEPNTVIINKGDSQNGTYLTAIADTSYMVGNNSNRFVSGFDDCFYFADSAFDWNAPMYYGDGSQWIKFKN